MRTAHFIGYAAAILSFGLLLQACSGGGASQGSTSSGAGGSGSGGGGHGGAASSSSSASGSGAGGGGGAPSCALADSGPVVATKDGEVIENLHIVSTNGPAIQVQGHAKVVIRNVRIEHAGGPGIIFSDADDISIQNVSITFTGAPPSGANPDGDFINIHGEGSQRPKIDNARLTRGSSGVYLLQCPDSALHFIEGHDFRGPFPRGQLVQWDKSDGGVLEDFSVENPKTSWPEDNVNVYKSVNMQIRRGLIDGNNSPSGVGVIFDGDTSLGVVEDVDAVHMGNGCFSDYAGADGAVFRRTRCRDNICEDQGRGKPSSNALMWAGKPGNTQIRLEQSTYFAACNPGNIVWPTDSFAVVELDMADFTLRAPIKLSFCWE